MSTTLTGVVYCQRDGLIAHLPLEEVKVDALVVDGMCAISYVHANMSTINALYTLVSARVTVRQVFINSSQTSTSRAKYIFPLPAHAAVCAFEMHTSGGRRIIGEAKEKSQAKSEHREALAQGKLTGLVENAADDGEREIYLILTFLMIL